MSIKVRKLNNLDDLMAIMLEDSFGDPRENHERGMEHAMGIPKIAAMEPVTARKVTKLSAHTFHISPEGYDEEDPHAVILLRNPMNESRWRLYSICPRTINGMTSYRLRGDEETVIRQAKLILDLGLGVIKPSNEDIMSGGREEDDEEHDEGGHVFGTERKPKRGRGTEEGDSGSS